MTQGRWIEGRGAITALWIRGEEGGAMRVADGPPKKGGGQIQKSWWKARVASDDKAAPFGDVAASNARQAAIVFARDSRRMNQLGLTIEVITHEGIERFEVVPRVAFIATSVGVQVLPAVNSAGR